MDVSVRKHFYGGNFQWVQSQTADTYQNEDMLPITDAFCVCIGNSWGVDTQTGEGCVGCGPQEEFYACADVKISQNGGTVAMPTTATTTTTTTVPPTPTVDIVCANGVYVASDTYASSPTMTPWCEITCPTGYCPSSHCQCG